MDSNMAFNLEQRRSVYQGLGLGVNRIRRVCVSNRSDWLCLLLLLSVFPRVVKFDVSLQSRGMRSVIRRSFLEFLLLLLVFLLIWGRNDAPTTTPWHTSTKADSDPLL